MLSLDVPAWDVEPESTPVHIVKKAKKGTPQQPTIQKHQTKQQQNREKVTKSTPEKTQQSREKLTHSTPKIGAKKQAGSAELKGKQAIQHGDKPKKNMQVSPVASLTVASTNAQAKKAQSPQPTVKNSNSAPQLATGQKRRLSESHMTDAGGGQVKTETLKEKKRRKKMMQREQMAASEGKGSSVTVSPAASNSAPVNTKPVVPVGLSQSSKKKKKKNKTNQSQVQDTDATQEETFYSAHVKFGKTVAGDDSSSKKHKRNDNRAESNNGRTSGQSEKQEHDPKFPFAGAATLKPDKHLTPLQLKMQQRLQGSHFRMLNEELYTTESRSAQQMFKTDPSLFESYHVGFREQTKRWPTNPVHVIIKHLRANKKIQRIADLGCGDAQLAHDLQDVKQKIHSYDLVAKNKLVTACDIAHVPLKNGAVQAVVLSLALMGTNYADFLREAHRIVETNGQVLVAEIRSRLDAVLEDFVALLQDMGFRVDRVDKENKMFIMIYLTKTARLPALSEAPWQVKASAPRLSPPALKPCQYKRR